jgi:uncharacterized caspase-like protein
VALQLDPADTVLREGAIAPAARPVREASALLTDVDRPLARPARPNPLAVGLVVGVERYNRSLPGVPWAGRDAQAVARYFQDVLGVPADQLVVLTDDQATLTGLEVALAEALPARIQPGESHLYVYFAGHGTPDPTGGSPYLVPFDGQLTSPAKTCLATARLYRHLVALRARQATVFLDACFTGSTGRDLEPKPLLADARPVVVASLDGALPKGVRVLTASGPGEVSSSHPEARHGLFTYFLLKALRREEAPFEASLRLADLEAYLRQHVGREAIRLNRSQQPRLLGERTAEADLLP